VEAALETIEIETAASPVASVIWLHGLGADGNDFVPIVDELDLPAGVPIRFVFPHAPMMPVTINNGYVMRAWYDVSLDGIDRRPDAAGIRQSQAAVEKLIDREVERGSAPERIVLAGFSQGGAITLQAGLRHRRPLAGLMVLSSYLPLPETLIAEAAPENAHVPLFIAHGEYDAVVPMELGTRSADRLRESGYPVEWHAYPMQHSVCAQEIVDVGRWLKRVLGNPATKPARAP
jgi:phospholipase/carboxylesterase